MKILIETGNEKHTSSWQRCQAKFYSGEMKNKDLYKNKETIVSQEWLNEKHMTLVKSVFDLPEGTEILIDYQGHEGPEKFVVRLDASQDVREQEVGTSRLRTYTIKGRYVLVCDLIKEAEEALKKTQTEGF